MRTSDNKFVINLEINGRKIIFSNIVWNTKTCEHIGYDEKGDNIIVCRIRPQHYDITITTNKSIPAYTEQEQLGQMEQP